MKDILICHHLILDVIKKGNYKPSLQQYGKANSSILTVIHAINACQNIAFS
jgi:hypothetical protein